MKASDKAVQDFGKHILDGELVVFKSVRPGEPFDTVVLDSMKRTILFKKIEPSEEVADDQILSFISKSKWEQMVNQNLMKERYIESLSKESQNNEV